MATTEQEVRRQDRAARVRERIRASRAKNIPGNITSEIPESAPDAEDQSRADRVRARIQAASTKPEEKRPGLLSRLFHEEKGRLGVGREFTRGLFRAQGQVVEGTGGMLQATAVAAEAVGEAPFERIPVGTRESAAPSLYRAADQPLRTRGAKLLRGVGEELEETGRIVQEFYPASMDIDRLDLTDPNTLAAGFGEAIGQLGAQITFAMATSGLGPIVQFLAFAGPTASMEGGGAFLETKERLIEAGMEFTEAEQMAAGVATTTALGALAIERIPAARFVFRRIPGAKGLFGARAAKLMSGKAGMVTNLLTGGASEATEEVLQEVWSSLLQDIQANNPEAWKDIGPRIKSSAVFAFGAGGTAGMAIGTTGQPDVAPPEGGEAPAPLPTAEPVTDVTEPPTAPEVIQEKAQRVRDRIAEAAQGVRRRVADAIDPGRAEELQEAFTDPKTDLANQGAWEKARPNLEADPAKELVLVDLKNFKAVNDLESMEAGDAKLREVADHLRTLTELGVPARDIFRAGGDEFVIAVQEGTGEEVGQRIVDLIGETEIGDSGIQFGARYGVGQTFDEADQAAQAAKAEEEGQRFREVLPKPDQETAREPATIITVQFDKDFSDLTLEEVQQLKIFVEGKLQKLEDVKARGEEILPSYPRDLREDLRTINARLEEMAGPTPEEAAQAAKAAEEVLPKPDRETISPAYETGKTVSIPFVRNTEPAPDMGSRFQQDIEPAGRYVNVDDMGGEPLPGWEKGEVTFDNPLVLPWNENEEGGYDETSWKAVLSERYGGKTGEALSDAIREDGFDGVITIRKGSPDEIVDLTQGKRKPVSRETEEAVRKTIEAPPETREAVTEEKAVDLPIQVAETDLPLDQAIAAHNGTSMVPERRGQQEQRQYVQHIQNVYTDLLRFANTDEKKALLAEELERYREGYLKKTLAFLGARSQVMSTMITGPANFPVRANEKKSDTAHRRLQELLAWSTKTQVAIRRKLTPEKAPVSSDDPNAPEILQKKVDEKRAFHEKMKAANQIVRRLGTEGEEVRGELRELGLQEKTVQNILTPDFAGRTGFPSFLLTNNLKEIKRLEGRIKEISTQRATAPIEDLEFDGGTVTEDVEANRLQIFFDEKPDSALRGKLKAHGFRWAPSIAAWQRKRSAKANRAAEEVLGISLKVEPAPEIEPEAEEEPVVEVPLSMEEEAAEAPEEEVPEPAWKTRVVEASTEGDTQNTLFPGDNRKVQTRYMVMDASDLFASHSADFALRSPDEFPAEIQGRAYHGARGRQAREQTEQIVTSFDPERALDPTISSAEGPAIVTPQGVTVAGNGRLIVMQRLPRAAAEAYREELVTRALDYGLDPREISGMNRPVLVRVITDPAVDVTDTDQLRRLNASSDVPTGKAKDVLSDAATRADQFRSSTEALNHFTETIGEDQTIRSYLETGAGREFLKKLVVSGVIAESERARFLDVETGIATDEGKTMVERVFFAAAVGDPDIISRAPSAILRKLDTSLPSIITASQMEGWEVGGVVGKALDLLASARATDQKLQDFVSQVDITRPEPSPASVEMARFLDEQPKKAVREAFSAYAQDALAWTRQTASEDLFGFEPQSAKQSRNRFYQLTATGPISSRWRRFQEVKGRTRAIRDGEIHPLTPFTDLFGEATRQEAFQDDLFAEGGIQGISVAIEEARSVISSLEGAVRRGQASKAQITRFEEARTIIRAYEGRGLDAAEVAARIPEGTVPEPTDTRDLFDTLSLNPLQQASERLPQANQFTAVGEGKGIESPVATIKSLTASLSKVLEGLKVAEGVPRPFRKKSLGIFKKKSQVIRLQQLADVVTFGHEAGHAMENLFFGRDRDIMEEKLPPEAKQELMVLASGISDETLSEGWAEFWRRYLDNPSILSQEAPATLGFVESRLDNYPGVREAWNRAQEKWNTFREGGALARVSSKINVDTDPSTLTIADQWSRARTNYLDDMHPLKELTDFVRGKTELEPWEDVEMLARLTRGSTGQGIHFLEEGTLRFSDLSVKGKSLRAILAPVKKNLDDFRAYIVSRRAVELHEREKVTGFRDEDVRQVVEELEAKYPDAAPVTLQEGRARPDPDAPVSFGFKTAFRELRVYNNHLLEYLRDAGVISGESLEKILELNQNYVPFYRVTEGERLGGSMSRNFGHLFSPVKRLKGSARDVIDPIESIIKNTMVYANLAARQQVSNGLAALATKEGIGEHLEEVLTPIKPTKLQLGEVGSQIEKSVPGFNDLLEEMREEGKREWEELTEGMGPREIADQQRTGQLPDGPHDPALDLLTIFRPGDLFQKENVISVLQDGKRAWFEVDPDLFKALQGLDHEFLPAWARLMSKPARLLRAGATLAPEFQFRNPFRDQVMAFVQSEYGYTPFVDLTRGIFELTRKGEAYRQWIASGGQRASLLALDRKTMQQNVRNMIDSGGVMNVVKDPLDMLRAISAFMEDGTRMGEFLNARAVEGETKIGLQRSSLAAREISVDFARHGAQLAAIRAMSSFWNARLQGYDRLAKAFKKHPVTATAKAVIMITIPSLFEYYLNRDDDDYWELPQWRRDLFWNIRLPDWLAPGSGVHFLALPKPFELGLIFGTLPIRILEWIDSNDPEGIDQFFRDTMLREAAGIIPFPTAIEPIVEGVTNYSFFYRRPIDPEGEKRVTAKHRGTETASEVAKVMTRWLPGEGISPRKVDNLLFSWSGGLGRLATDIIDVGVDVAIDRSRPKRPLLQTVPGLRGIIAREPGFGSESIERFYRELGRARTAKATLNYFAQRNMIESHAKELQDERANLLRSLAPVLEATSRNLSQLRKQRNVVIRDPLMDPAEKQSRLLELGREATAEANKILEFTRGASAPRIGTQSSRRSRRSR